MLPYLSASPVGYRLPSARPCHSRPSLCPEQALHVGFQPSKVVDVSFRAIVCYGK